MQSLHNRKHNSWFCFFNSPAVWKAVLVVAVYMVLFEGIGFAVGKLAALELTAPQQLLQIPRNIFFGLTLPIALGSALLLLFARSVGWLKPLFGPQPMQGKWWMWLVPALVITTIVGRLIGIDYATFSTTRVALFFLTGLFIGTAEELLTRGIVVKMLRDARQNEWKVMVFSSFLFAIIHSANLLTGQDLSVTLMQVAFAFGFGVWMYISLRVTGNLIYPILLHGAYDPSLFLATGGINKMATATSGGNGSRVVELATLALLILTVASLLLVRGKVNEEQTEQIR